MLPHRHLGPRSMALGRQQALGSRRCACAARVEVAEVLGRQQRMLTFLNCNDVNDSRERKWASPQGSQSISYLMKEGTVRQSLCPGASARVFHVDVVHGWQFGNLCGFTAAVVDAAGAG